MNLENTVYFKSLNVTEEQATKKAALVKAQRAYTDYVTKKVLAEANVKIAEAEKAKIIAIEGINASSTPVASEFNSPEEYGRAVDAQVIGADKRTKVIEETDKVLLGETLKLNKIVEWGTAQGFEGTVDVATGEVTE